jgi:superfamily II DNA or RNA helicase
MNKKADYSYQKTAVERVWNLLHDSSNKPVILASVVGSGKSYMAKDIVGTYLNTYSGNVIFLAHCQTVLSEQFMELLSESADYKFSNLGGDQRVQVGLPTYFVNNTVNSIDFLVIDEAHEYYEAGMIQGIIEKYNPRFVLMLTGTPGKYNGDDRFLFHYVSGDEMMERDVYSGVDIDMVSVSSGITSDMMYLSMDRITEKLGKNPEKLMVVCESVEQSKEVKAYLGDLGYNPALSTNESDPDSGEIQRFKNNKDCRALIVVKRGILGFNCESMDSMIDLKGSMNLDIVFQALARLFRKHPAISEKSYVRVVHPKKWDDELEMLHKVVGLLDMNNFKTYKPQGE